MSKSIEAELVSIVVSTRNEARNIENCLSSISLQTYASIEIIVVDNSSADCTKDIARRYTNSVFNFGPERSAQRNFGLLNKSNGSILGYIDADMILGPDVVNCAVTEIRSGSIGVYVPEIILGSSYLNRTRRFERSFYGATVIDAVRFFRRDAFFQIGGFDESLFERGSGEDWDLNLMLGELGPLSGLQPKKGDKIMNSWSLRGLCESLGYVPDISNAIYHNESDINLTHYLRKKSYYSQGFQGYKLKWGGDHPVIYRQFSGRYRLMGVFLENGKWRQYLAHPVRAGGVIMLRAMVGIVYIRQLIITKRRHFRN